MRQFGAELRAALRQLQVAPQSAHAGLRLHLRERLESVRGALLGRYSLIPASLRHYAVSLTEVQWLLDAWIAGSEAGSEDEAQLQREFFHAASRLFDDDAAEHSPEPAARSRWWSRWWSAWRRGGAAGDAEPLGPDLPQS